MGFYAKGVSPRAWVQQRSYRARLYVMWRRYFFFLSSASVVTDRLSCLGENEMGAGTCLKADVLAFGNMPSEAVRG